MPLFDEKMQTAQTSCQQWDRYQYLLIISPDGETSARIMKIKKEFDERYCCGVAGRSYPHLTLVKFRQPASMEDHIVSNFAKFCRSVTPFEIILNGFASFSPHTIYVKVENPEPVAGLVKNLRNAFGRLLKTTGGPRPAFITNPHITIARQLSPLQHQQAWEDWKHDYFSGRFPAESMLLLKRPNADVRYETLQRFSFTGTSIPGKQTRLF